MLFATIIALELWSTWPLLGAGVGLLCGLVVVARSQWTPNGAFGRANAVTALRVGGLGLFPIVVPSPTAVVGLSLCFLLADGVDGWLARNDRQTSTFGAFFDKEADALFLLVLCAGAVMQGHVPPWGLAAGLLRYGFVVALFWMNPPEKTEERFNAARYIYGAMVGALLVAFLSPAVGRPLAGLAMGALVGSFGRSLWQMRAGSASP